MSAAAARRLRRLALGGALGLLALALPAPRPAAAACGASHDRPVVGLDALSLPLAHPERPSPARRPREPGRCPGGVCSRSDLPAPAAPSAETPRRIEAWPCLPA